jgi:ketosteroid isomerase-like protein
LIIAKFVRVPTEVVLDSVSARRRVLYREVETMSSDTESITRAVLDYFEGWFDGDSARMERALHHDLVKRSPGDDQASSLGITTAEQMVEWTKLGAGKPDATDRRIEVEVQDVYEDIASVLVRSAPYHEYLHLVRTRDGWKIANALWRPT